MNQQRHIETRAVRAGLEADHQHGAIMPPIYLSSNFSFEGFRKKRVYDYTRSGNPTRDILAETIAELEGGQGAVITSTGMSAITLALQLLKPGDLLIAPHDCYGGTHRLFTAQAQKGHFEVVFANLTDPEKAAEVLQRKATMVWIETPSNPLLRITDIRKIARQAHDQGAYVVVDNTFLSPICQQPIELGADLVIHSTTKYLNGHSDVVGGAVVARTQQLHEQLIWWANCLGITGAPFDSYLTLRGLRTLKARMRLHLENAQALVDILSHHPAVTKVYHPSLKDHPGHAIAVEQQTGFGAMISFELAGGDPSVEALIQNLRCFSLAESLGGVESLIAHPATMTHAAMVPEARAIAGISESLIRLSVGIEASEDLERDLSHALDQALAALSPDEVSSKCQNPVALPV